MTFFCIEKLGRLPCELTEIPMSELMRGMIAWSVMQDQILPK